MPKGICYNASRQERRKCSLWHAKSPGGRNSGAFLFRCGKVDYVDESLLYKLADILKIDYLSLTRNNIYKSTFLYTNDMRLDLLNLKNVKGFSSISETIKYCIDFTVNEISKSNVSTEIMNNVREAIVNTFIQEMDKLSHAHEMDALILQYLDDKYGTNSNELRTDIEQYLTKIKHSKNY